MNRNKKATSVIAGATAAAIALAGTFAWVNTNQSLKNEVRSSNPGGRLHDDFNGYTMVLGAGETSNKTKDVYVENFGNQNIYARIKLTEYMERGTGAGRLNTDGSKAAENQATPLVENTKIDDVSTWTIHKPTDDSAATGSEEATFHEYWTWTMGGEDTAGNPNAGTVYMPTFNKNGDSLMGEANGTLWGKDGTGNYPYDDYTKYTEGQTVDGTAYYDIDENTDDEGSATGKLGNGGEENVNYQAVNETHTAKSTLTKPAAQSKAVITMKEWKALPEKTTYTDDTKNEVETVGKDTFQGWVYDEDGWAYWSQAIAPETATSLLLDRISLNEYLTGEWYYGINVVAQFITGDELGSEESNTGFYDSAKGTAPTANALELLKIAGVKTGDGDEETKSGVEVTDPSGKAVDTTLSLPVNAVSDGRTYKLTATGLGDNAGDTWTWSKTSGDANISVAKDGTISVAEASEGLSAVLKVTNADNSIEKEITVNITEAGKYVEEYDGTYHYENDVVTLQRGESLTFVSRVYDVTVPDDQDDVTWTVDSFPRGSLAVASDAAAGKYQIIMKNKNFDDGKYTVTFYIEVPAASTDDTTNGYSFTIWSDTTGDGDDMDGDMVNLTVSKSTAISKSSSEQKAYFLFAVWKNGEQPSGAGNWTITSSNDSVIVVNDHEYRNNAEMATCTIPANAAGVAKITASYITEDGINTGSVSLNVTVQ